MLSPRYPASPPSDNALSCPYISDQEEQRHIGFGSASRASYITQEWQGHPGEMSVHLTQQDYKVYALLYATFQKINK